MTISSQFRSLLCAGIAGALTFAAPVLAQDEHVPPCSAAVTDHCVQREGGMHAAHHAMAGQHRAARDHRHHRMARHHHRHHVSHHHRHHAAAAKKG